MPWPVHPTGFFGARGDQDSYRIERSLRFNSADSAYLGRTLTSAGNRKTWTWSAWVKRTVFGNNDILLFAGQNGPGDSYIYFSPSNTFGAGVFGSGGWTWLLESLALYRDPSSWYHFVVSIDTTQATASERVKLYANGIQITSFSTSTYPSQNFEGQINNNLYENRIGVDAISRYLNGYVAEINFIDGQALTPSSFGETDAITGRWKAKAYSGTYGTNGFYLKFADNSGTTSTTLGKDSSPNGNNWTPNNFSVTAGAGNDSLVDSPTNYGTDTGVGGEVRGNYCTLNPLDQNRSGSPTNGNLEISGSNSCKATFEYPSIDKWYYEFVVTGLSGTAMVGIASSDTNSSVTSGTLFLYRSDGQRQTISGASSYGASYTSGDVIGIAFDSGSNSLVFYKNNVSQGSITPTSGVKYFPMVVTSSSTLYTVNFGQRPFAYTAPSGFKALCTTNLPQPTIQKPSSAMDVVTYTGNGSARSITGLGFSPDLVWIKGRSGATDHALYDTTRGAQSDLVSNTTGSATTQSQGLTAFNSDGFTIGTLAKLNTNTSTYVAWAWDEAAIDGLDIVSYSGNSSTQNVSHGLGVAPSMIIVKTYSPSVDAGEGNWCVYHRSLGANKFVYLDLTNAAVTSTTIWNNTAPTASVFSLGNDNNVNKTGKTQIAYCFAEVEGFSKFGSYTGNGATDGPFVFLGFRPRYILFKNSTTGGAAYDWFILDTARHPSNTIADMLFANLSSAQANSYLSGIDILSNGFKIRDSSAAWNQSSGVHIFAAFAESPFKYARAR